MELVDISLIVRIVGLTLICCSFYFWGRFCQRKETRSCRHTLKNYMRLLNGATQDLIPQSLIEEYESEIPGDLIQEMASLTDLNLNNDPTEFPEDMREAFLDFRADWFVKMYMIYRFRYKRSKEDTLKFLEMMRDDLKTKNKLA